MNVIVMINVFLLLTSPFVVSTSGEHENCECTCEEPSNLRKYGVPVATGIAAVAAAPYAVAAAGFTGAGVAAGTLAAKAMALAGTTGWAGGVVATLQSIGAAGMGVGGMFSTFTAGAGTGWLFGSGSNECDCCKKN